jgi:splicing factor 3B subunit 4
VAKTQISKDRIIGYHQACGFIGYFNDNDNYDIKIANVIKFVGRQDLGVGAISFLENLDPYIKEMLLYFTFSVFGFILETLEIIWEANTGNVNGYSSTNFASFDALDATTEAMTGQYLCICPISVP